MATMTRKIGRLGGPAAVVCMALFCVVFGAAGTARGQEPGGWPGGQRPRRGGRFERADPGETDIPPTEPIHSGFVILNDQYVPPPYVLELHEGALRVNGEAVDLRGFHWPGPWGDRRRGGLSVHRFRRVEEHLRDDGLLLALEDELAVPVPAFEAVELLQILLDEDAPRAEKVERLMSLQTVRTTSGHWGRLLDTFEPGPQLAGRLQELEEQMQSMRARTGAGRGQGLGRTRIVSLLSVVLAALAIGILLTHMPHHEKGWTGIDDSENGQRRVLWLVGLLVVLNVFDLVCTILAAEAGGFLELNPLVERHLGSPGAVVAFKSFLVLGGATVLILCRRHRIVQVTSWGAALVYTVITLRWAVVGSMFVA